MARCGINFSIRDANPFSKPCLAQSGSNFSIRDANPFSKPNPNPDEEEDGLPTIFERIIFKNGRYEATGLDPYFDSLMDGRVKWMTATDGGQNISSEDDSIYAHEARTRGLPPTHTPVHTGIAHPSDRSKSQCFTWLGDPCNMVFMGIKDMHKCSVCKIVLSNFIEGDTFLNQHAYYTPDCPYLNANYTADRLKLEIGYERYRRGFIAHPEAIIVPDAWNPSKVILTNNIYITLAGFEICFLCGRKPHHHAESCYQNTCTLIQRFSIGLKEFRLYDP